MKELLWLLLIPIFIGVIAGLLQPNKKSKRKKRNVSTNKKTSNTSVSTVLRTSKSCRADDIILTSSLSDINGVEFERLLALYFRDQGYTVHEVGIGGNDGGVDLVIIDKRGEKTAVQAKCYADHNLVPVQTVRELVAAKRNHDCILTLLITTSDLTGQAKKEAEQFRVEYWHGGIIEQKLRAWGKWRPTTKSKAK
ncbi:restriction endonuclease [Cohnella silvisoli]|uniref:Restriction endonuclease n=1 Tax=Cohnella silvisoli TaxID=2873699 RepID=A0ABV1KMX7_9BACL|nr:restriction endonuclease [Cohnella silvisoli]MCD9020222.1 restriction endonuclease [Cohnella silvisoli]